MTTLKDIAKETNLTVTTVSRVINNRGYISNETRQKVTDAMEKLHYQPNEIARSLSKQESRTIGVIVPHIIHPYFAGLISHIELAANEKGYKILLFNSLEKKEKESEYLTMCQSSRVTGIILCSSSFETVQFEKLGIPLITIERFLDGGLGCVECDNHQGGRLAAQHLWECGCKRVVHISKILGVSMPADERENGFSEVCDQYGMYHREVKTSLEEYSSLNYGALIRRILEEEAGIDGIFAGSDVIAAQVLQICSEMKLLVPQDIRVIGFDDTFLARLTTPPLTSIRQPLSEMAAKAVEKIIKTADTSLKSGQSASIQNKIIFPVTLIKRESTGEMAQHRSSELERSKKEYEENDK